MIIGATAQSTASLMAKWTVQTIIILETQWKDKYIQAGVVRGRLSYRLGFEESVFLVSFTGEFLLIL